MKKIWLIFTFISLVSGGLVSCSDDDDNKKKEFIITISSVKRVYNGLYDFCPYFAKYDGNDYWTEFLDIEEFEHEEGYEYVLRVKWEIINNKENKYILLETISKTKKQSEDIPDQIISFLIASKRPPGSEASYYIKDGSEWTIFDNQITGFNYEEGYEYSISVRLRFREHEENTSKYRYILNSYLGQEKKLSEGLPSE